jgi:hypothetical protein
MRTDKEILDWLMPIFRPECGVTAEESEKLAELVEKIDAAIQLGFREREALSAAMGALIIEPGAPPPQLTGIQRIALERDRQINVLGYDPDSDDQCEAYDDGRLAICASIYALPESLRNTPEGYDITTRYEPSFWPKDWPARACRYRPHNPIRDLEKAGALCAAEIDRLLADSDGK